MIYKIREEQVRAEISKDRAINLIEVKYHAQYDPNGGVSGNFDAWDQFLVCEAIAEATPIPNNYFFKKETERTNENAIVNGSVNGSYKHDVNFELTESKLNVLKQLNACTYRTSPIKVAALLEEFFREWPFREWTGEQNYWLLVSQKYPPLPIVRVIKLIIKQHVAGVTTVRNPAKLFSFLIKKRTKRKRRL